MNRTSTTILLAAVLSLAASAVAGPPSTFSGAVPPRAKSPAPVKSEPAASTAGPTPIAPASAPNIFLVWRGAPKSAAAGLTYVDAAGRELAKSPALALEKATANAFAAAEREHAVKHAGNIGQ